ncbi:hypothetical protein SGLAM104S_00596 [Streptomyces glaucescens]
MLSFSPDGHTVASVGGDSSDTGAVRLWAVSGSERTSAFTTLPIRDLPARLQRRQPPAGRGRRTHHRMAGG